MLNIERIRNILVVTFLVWIVGAVALVVVFDLYDNLYFFFVFTRMCLIGITSLDMIDKFL